MRVPPEAPVRQAFIHLRTLILEMVEVEGDGPALWGVTVVVADLDACARELGPLLGDPARRRPARAPDRHGAARGRAADALAFMTPRPQRSPAP